MKRFLVKVRGWWRRHISSMVPKEYEDMFDEYYERDEDGNIKRY